MKFYIKGLKLDDFRNIKCSETVWLKYLTSLVGANESGKTSLLEAVSQLKNYNLTIKDTTRDAVREENEEFPVLTFYLDPDKDLRTHLSNFIANDWDESYLSLEVVGSNKKDWRISLAKQSQFSKKPQIRNIKLISYYQNNSKRPIDIRIGKETIKLSPRKITRFKGNSSYNMRLVKENGPLIKLEEDELMHNLLEEILNVTPEIKWWPPRKLLEEGMKKVYKKYYLSDEISWEKFIEAPKTYPTTKLLFDLASMQNKRFSSWHSVLSKYKKRNATREINTYLEKIADVITSFINDRWQGKKINIHFHISDKANLVLSIKEGKKSLEPSTRSEGFKWFLSFLLNFFADSEKIKDHVFLMDQPGEYLHPGGQKELRHRLEEIVGAGNQIIYTTQSPFLIDRNEWGKTQFLDKADEGTCIRQPLPGDISNDTLLRESLGYTLPDVGQANELNIVPEGYTDRCLLLTIARLIKNSDLNKFGNTKANYDLNRLGFIEATGIHGETGVIRKVQQLRNNKLKAIGIYDYDVTGKREYGKARKDPDYGMHIYSLGTLLQNSKCETGEDLIPETIYRDILEEKLTLKDGSKLFKNNREKEKLINKPRLPELTKKYESKTIAQEELWPKVFKELKLIEKESKFISISKDKEVELVVRLLNKAYKNLSEEK